MKKICVILLTILLFISCSEVPVKSVESFVSKTASEFCPDRRVNIFDVEYEQSGKVVTLKGEINSSQGLKTLVSALEDEGYRVANKVRVLPDQQLEGNIYGVVNRPVANMRVEPSARSEMATQAVLGVPLRLS